ncbi:MAG: alpha/beta fold hydrolase [Candidatus Saccharimonadales bacterium]
MAEQYCAIEYDLAGDFGLTHNFFVPEKRVEPDVLPAGTFRSDWLALDAIKSQVAMAFESSAFGGKPGQRLHYALINDEADSSGLTLINLHWGGRFHNNPEVCDTMAELVATNPDKRFLVYDNPGSGLSDPLPKALSRELSQTGRFDDYAAIVMDGLGKVLQNYDELDVLGRSQGGLVATELAAQIDHIESLVVFDPPGTPTRVLSFLRAYMFRERLHARKYSEHISGMTGAEYVDDTTWRSIFKEYKAEIVNGSLKTRYQQPIGLAKGQYSQALKVALPHISGAYVFLSPSGSELNDLAVTRSTIAQAVTGAGRLPRLVDQLVFSGSHAFGYGNPRAVPALESYASNYVNALGSDKRA